MDEPLDMNRLGKGRKGPWDKQLDCEGIDISAEKGKVNIIELEESHDAHVKEIERLQKELDELNNLKLVDQNGELLLECTIGDKNHQLLLEVGLNTILERFVKKEK
jgi:hypothetical protein